jgi:hypothetical protein
MLLLMYQIIYWYSSKIKITLAKYFDDILGEIINAVSFDCELLCMINDVLCLIVLK